MEVVLVLEVSRRLQLLRGVVDPSDAGTASGEPGTEVGGAATEFHDVHARYIGRERVELVLGNAEDAPGDLLAGPRPGARGGVQRCVDLVLVDAVAGDLLGQLGFGHRRIVASPVARHACESVTESGWPTLTVMVKVTHCDGVGHEGYGRLLAERGGLRPRFPVEVPSTGWPGRCARLAADAGVARLSRCARPARR